MWQITLEELTQDSFTPKKEFIHLGSWAYVCPICRAYVGLYRDDHLEDDGMLYKRDECKNGHRMDWNI